MNLGNFKFLFLKLLKNKFNLQVKNKYTITTVISSKHVYIKDKYKLRIYINKLNLLLLKFAMKLKPINKE